MDVMRPSHANISISTVDSVCVCVCVSKRDWATCLIIALDTSGSFSFM